MFEIQGSLKHKYSLKTKDQLSPVIKNYSVVLIPLKYKAIPQKVLISIIAESVTFA